MPCSEQLPDAVVSESVPASREEELGAWPDSPKLCSPRALLLLPASREQVMSIFLWENEVNSGIFCTFHSSAIFGSLVMTPTALPHFFPSSHSLFACQQCPHLTLLILLQAQGNSQLHHCLIICVWRDIQHRRESLCSSQKSLQRRRVPIIHVLRSLQNHGFRLWRGNTVRAFPRPPAVREHYKQVHQN